MSPSNELRVKPVKRYRAARYPSHNDPDPTQFPQKVPYPASRKFLAAVASIGLTTSSLSCSNDSLSDGPQSVGGLPTTLTSASEARNPFRVELSGLPHRTSAYGTGVPHYIEEDLARKVIEQTFKNAGYDLEPNQPIRSEGVACIADGYDKKKQIGYVFADWYNLENDALISWMTPPNQAGNISLELDDLLRRVQDATEQQALADEIAAANALPDPARRETALQSIQEKLARRFISLEEIKKLADEAPRTKQFVAVVSQFDTRFAREYWSESMREEMQAINSIPDPAKRDAALRELEEKSARVCIERLEQSVREYIAWARSQGAE